MIDQTEILKIESWLDRKRAENADMNHGDWHRFSDGRRFVPSLVTAKLKLKNSILIEQASKLLAELRVRDNLSYR